MDVVICLAKRDFRIVKKTVANVRKYLQEENDNIFLIGANDIAFYYSKSWLSSNHVVFINEDELCENLSFDKVKESQKDHFKCPFHTGWYLQQFLKMGFALSKYASNRYLVWDSDTIPLHRIEMESGGKYFLATKTENNTPYFDTMQKLLGFGKLVNFSFIAEHMVFETTIMKKLISEIESSDIAGTCWFEKILNATSGADDFAFSEFETYGNYCTKYYPDMFQIRELCTLREAGMLFGRGVTQKELQILANMGFDTASFEHYHIPPFPRSLVNKIENKIATFL